MTQMRVGFADRLLPFPVTLAEDRFTFYNAVDYAFGPNAAEALVVAPGNNNDMRITATAPGTTFNDVNVVFVPIYGLPTPPVVTFTPGPTNITPRSCRLKSA